METKKPKIVDKPWGREIWIIDEDEYAGKILEINKGDRTSLHYHEKKKESMYVLEGKMRVTDDGGNQFMLGEGESLTICCNEAHSLEALEDLRIIEVSMPFLDDVKRVKDYYGRI
ncbi:MAG: cupin [Candidatus Altiarchaeales archaeon ex4484_2]|nr:MAG: cupin [Candidatus Altiarchaeales archaeon ex4484_2]